MKNGFLQSKAELDEARQWLIDHGHQTHHDPRKDWDLRHVVEHVATGDILDMGCFGSAVLLSARHWNKHGRKVGIDLQPCPRIGGIEYHVGDLTDPPFEPASFDTVTCLSVIEHHVDVNKFAAAASRMLRPGGTLLVTFDYWEPKPDTSKYSDWQILGKADVIRLLLSLTDNRLLVDTFDWNTNEPCIHHAGYDYTFGFITAHKL